MLKEKEIYHQITSQQPNKAHIAENLIKQFKGYVKRYLRQEKTKRFIEQLENFVNGLNNRSLDRLQGLPMLLHIFSKTIPAFLGLSPIELNVDNQIVAIEHLRAKSAERSPSTQGIEVNDLVRIQLPKTLTTLEPRYSNELFIVSEKLSTRNPVLFKLTDLSGEPLDRFYYGKQLAVIKKNYA